MNRLPNPFPGQKSNTTQIKAVNNGILISVILDESGSMLRNQKSTISSFNEFKESQREGKDSCKLTLTTFSTPRGETTVKTVFDTLNIHSVPNLTEKLYIPSGNTPLYDAIGLTIELIDKHLSEITEKDRPSILVVILTDGEENSSRKFNLNQIKEMIKEHESNGFMFTFLGANIDSFSVGSSMGFSAANTVSYNTSAISGTMNAVSSSTSRYRSLRAAGASNEAILSSGLYTETERKKAKGE